MANRIVTLRAPGQEPATLKPGSSSGILLHLSDSVVQDITKAAKTPDALRFSAGPSPVRLPSPLPFTTTTNSPLPETTHWRQNH